MHVAIPPGVFDILPQDTPELWRSTRFWTYLESLIRQTASDYGFQEIRTPLFERTELFQRSVGETTDIVSKEMYTFTDKGGRSMSLRPEGTVSTMRAFIENQMHQGAPVQKLFYIGPMFRYERAQAGRYRQHHQFGAEVIGNAGPEQDAELIDLLYTLYNRIGLRGLQVSINSIGDPASRLAFRERLVAYFKKFQDELSADSKIRLETNPLRILDSKDPKDKEIVAAAPSILDDLNEECRSHFESLQKYLRQLNIPFVINPTLVRGLDYYNKTVFEIIAGELGAQNSIAGGGRYDGLLKSLGGPDLPTAGFGTGLERVIQTMIKQEVPIPPAYAPQVFLIALGDRAKETAFSLLNALRQQGVSAQMDFSNRKINKVMQYANQIRATYVVVIGDKEVETGQIEIKEMATGETFSLPISCLAQLLSYENDSIQLTPLLNRFSKPFTHAAQAQFFIDKIKRTINETNKIADKLKMAMHSMQELIK